jgi:SAP domain-containing protein
MAWPTYDKKQHEEQGDDYIAWLRTWNVEVPQPAEGQAPAQTDDTVEAQADKDGEPAVNVDPDAPARGDDYDEWTNEELRDELEKRELSKSGNKAELVARLREDDEAEA